MIVLVASRHDESARDIATRWAEHDARLLTCEDLSRAGWRHRLAAPEGSAAVIDGDVVACKEIRGVLTRRPCVLEQELSHVASPDREYVAAEMNAFLVSWLSSLACPVLNRPTAGCLSGPNWRPEQWIHAAARARIPVRTRRRCVPAASSGEPQSAQDEAVIVTVVGKRCLGGATRELMTQARGLAALAGVDLLQVAFSGREVGSHFLAANLWPDLGDPGVADAILDHLVRA